MKCDMKREPYKSVKGYPLYVCTRKGCRGHGFDRGHGIPERKCDHPRVSLGLGYILQGLLLPFALIFFVFGMACKCKERRNLLNKKFGFFVPFVGKSIPPWEDPAYKDRLTKV